jgi:hypothetical protein
MTLRSRAVARAWPRVVSAAIPAALLAATLAASLAVTLAGRAVAADPVTIQVHSLVGGRFEAGGWAAVAVSLANDNAPTSGYVAAESEDGSVRRLVELPAGSRKEVTIYLRPAAFARTVEVRFESVEGSRLAVASAEVRVLERTAMHVAIVGDGGGNLRPQLVARGASQPEPIPLAPADLPERPEPLLGIETIVWADDSASLTELQRRTLERWIGAGGQLMVLGGPDWQARTAGFGDLLPVESLRAVDDASLEPLAEWVGTEAPTDASSLTAATGALRDGAVELIGGTDGVLFASATRGAGRVIYLGVDLATAPFRAWPGGVAFWGRIVPDDVLARQFGFPGIPEEEIGGLMTQALAQLPSLEVPPAELLLLVLAGYILLIGPASYLILRRFDRRELAWVTAPVLVLTFSAGSYGIGASMKGSEIIVNEITLVRTIPDGSAASVSTFAGVFSPTRTSYDVTVRSDALMSGLRNTMVDPVLDPGTTTYATEQGDTAHLRGFAVSRYGLQSLRAEAITAYQPALHVDWAYTATGVAGTVTNTSETPIEDVAVISQSGGLMIGNLAAGASEAFNLPNRNLTGNGASQQVYGFANFDPSSAAQRRIAARRAVIDSLVGYGGGWGRDDAFSGGINRGPFVIGWQPDASPLSVELDGHTVQRYAQAIEILSGRPRLGPGPVVIQPSQLVTDVVSTAGEASQNEPGFVSVGNGEAVFRLSLPLEATGLAATSLTLQAGNDASIVVFDQPNFGSFLPDGYRLAAYDAAAGEWEDVGDLSVKGRFEIEDPTRLIDPAGRILVRISGTGIPQDFGQMSVFVSATIEGVLS